MELAGHVSKKMLQRHSHIGNTAKRQAISVFDTVSETPKEANLQGSPHFHPHSEKSEGEKIM
jgi:hypothetical protein